MAQLIHIPEPCSEDWNKMQKADACSRHCAVCKTNVHDFRNLSLSEINQKQMLVRGEKLCGKYHERHVSTSKKIYVFVNAFEERLLRIKMRRTAMIFVAALLFFSGCVRRHVQGRMKVSYEPGPQKHQATKAKY